MNACKRFFALILSLCMVLSFVPVSAFAAETGDEGSVTLTGAPTTPAGVSGNTEPFPLSVFTTYSTDSSNTGHFRIPVIVTMNDGRLVAAADVRWHAWDSTDDNGNIDTIVSYSTNNGESWTYSFPNYFGGTNAYEVNYGAPTYIDPGLGTDGKKLYMIVDLYPGQSGQANCTAGSSSNTGYDSQGRMLLRANASTTDTGYYLKKYDDGSGKTLYKIYDTNDAEQTGYIVDAYFNLYQDGAFVRNLFEYSTSSFMPVFTSHLYLTTSSNGGETWSEPTMINPSVRPGVGENCYLVNPGRGVYTKDGVLVFGGYRYPTQRANLMFSTDGGVTWKTTGFTNSESSESDIVELSDGTLRMFVRHSGNGNYVQYFDWTPVKDADGNVTDYTPSSAVNTTAVAHNNTNVTAISYSKTSDGKQVVLVAAPGDTSGAYSRYNGKIFTFTVDPQTKAMTLVNTVEVNRAGEPYSYSSLTELDDGTVGLLYEKGDSGNITYVEYDPEELTGLEFDGTYDIFVFGSDNTQGEVKVKKTAGVTHIHTQPNTSVTGVDGDYVAYDVVLCTDAESDCTDTFDCTNVYTGEAKVTVPVSSEMAAKELKGFVVNSDGSLDYVKDVTVNNVDGVYLATFKAPHFSTVGVMPKTAEELTTVEKDVTVKVGGTHVETMTGVNLNGSNAGQASAATATVTWTGTETVVTYPTAQLGTNASFAGDTIDLNDCLYTFTKNSDNTWVVSAEIESGTVYINPHAGASNGGKPNRNYVTNITLVAGTDGAIKFKRSTDDSNGDVGFLHFWDNDANKCYWDQCTSDNCTGHNLLIYKVADTSNTTTILGGYYTQVTDIANLVSGEQYLIVGKHNNGSYYVMHPTTSGNSDKYAHVAKVTGGTATRSEYETKVIIEGVTEGTTSVAIGDTLYNITVDGEIKEVDVGLKVGETTTIEDNTGYYIPTYTGKGLNESVATVTLSGTTTDVAQDVADTGVTAIQSGKQYAIVCKRSATNGAAGYDPENSVLTNDLNGSSLHMNGPLADDTTEVWTITQDGNGYTVQDAAGKYLTFGNNGENVSVSDTKTVLTLTYNADGGYWRIYNNGYWLSDKYGAANENALAYNQENDDGNNWVIYEVTPAHTAGTTSIVIKGVAEGETSVVVGNTQYNIIVNSNIPECFVMRNVSTATVVNTLPTLPAKVCGVLQDGSLVKDANGGNYQYTVEWDAITADMFDTAGEIVTVNGTVAFDDGTTKPVTCTVRVAPAPAASADIIDSNTTLTEDLPSGVSAADNLQSLKDGNTAPGEGTNDRWSNWNYRSGYTSATITLDWGSVKTIDQVKLYFRDDNGCDLPTSVTFQYSEDGVTYRDIGSSKTDVTAINKTYALNEAVDARYLKVVLGHNDGRGVALYEIEVFTAAVGDLTYNNSADLSNLTVDGSTVAGFDPDVLQYDVAAYRGTVAAATEDTVNAGITILPVYEGVVRVLTVSEDGTEAKTYEITFDTASLAQVDVTLNVGQTEEFEIEGAGYDSDDVTNDDNTVASVTAQPQSETRYVKGNEITAQADLVVGKQYVIRNDLSGKNLVNVKSGSNLTLDGTVDNIAQNAVWTLVAYDPATGVAKLQDCNGKYLTIGGGSADIVDAENEINLVYRDAGHWNVTEDGHYLNNASGSHTEVHGWTNCNQPDHENCQWSIFEVSTVSESSTQVSIEGLKVGTTTAKVGHVTYNITVKEIPPVTVDVVLKVGETKPCYIEEFAYTEANVATAPNATIAGMTVLGHNPDDRLSLTDEIKSGREYLIVVNNRTEGNNATHNTLSHSAHINNTNYLTIYNNYTEANTYWIIEKAPGDANKYYVKTPYGAYLAIESAKAYTTDTPTALDLVYDAAGYWTISGTVDGTAYYLNQYEGVANDYAAGHNPIDANCRWEIYERTENAHTQVVFTGNAVGTTTARVGHVTYNITVAADTRDVEIFVGETWKDVLDGINATGSNAGQTGANIADVTWNGSAVYTVEAKRLAENGSEESIVNLADSEVTFTNTDGKFTINATDDIYVNINGYPVSSDAAAITVTFEADGSARLRTDAGHYLRVYTYADGAPEWHRLSGSSYSSTDETCKFFIYAPVTDAAESSTEVPGYKKLTAVDQIVSGEGYLIAFEHNGTYYIFSYENTSTGKYNNMARLVTNEAGAQTAVTVVGKASGNTKVEIEGVLYNITVKPYEKNFSVEIGASAAFEPASEVTDADIDAFNAANGSLVTVALVDGKLVFTGVAEGSVAKYLLGGTLYDIKVTRDVVDGDESKYVGGQSGTQGEGQVITGLIVSNDTVYDLNMAADVTGVITWESSDESVFIIDQNGTVTSGSNAGEAYVNVYRDGSLYQTIPVIVIETPKTEGNNREVDIYNTEVTNCTAYYTYNKEDIAIFPEGYQFYAIHSKTETDLITFYATPNQGYALSFVNGVNGTWFHTVTNPDGTGYLTDSGTHSDTHKMNQGQNNGAYYSLHDQLIAYVVNNSGSYAADLATVHKMLDMAVLMEVDGGFFYSRGVGTGEINDSTRFVADKLPEVKKSVNGILGVSGLQADWVLYQDGMYAEVGEIVYFTIQIEQEAPTAFKKSGGNIVTDAYGQVAALEYTAGASLVDNMKDAYFYTKELDLDDDIDGDGISYEGVLSPDEQKTVQDVTDALNRGWTQEELDAGKRVHEYYVVYPIKSSDLNSSITNTVELAYTYSSTYSNGSRDLSGNAEASLLVLGQSLGDVLVDFGLPVVLEGLTEQQLPGVTADNLADVVYNTNDAQDGCVYGSVNIVRETDGTFTLTYTPDKVMTSYDVVYIMDANNQLINYLRIRPASTVYYEESFAEFGTANPVKDGQAAAIGWTGHNSPVTGTQEYQHTGCNDDHDHNNFGYDGKYAAETGKSNGTEAISTLSGDTATFTFNGTGFEVYANCDPDTSIMTVMLYRQTYGMNGVELKLTKFLQVVTKTQNTDYTGNEITNIDADGLPVVSVNGLDYGTYKVVIRHTKKMDDTTSEIRFDGFRIFNTIEQGDQYYPQDEWSPVFTELRDEVLYTAGVTSDSSQTYNENTHHVGGGATVVFLRDQDNTQTTDEGTDTSTETSAADIQDWLDNGPKNEIWMLPGDNLAFKLSTGDPTTQGGAVVFAQLGLKAPSGSVTFKITMLDPNGNVLSWQDADGNTVKAEKEYTITTATDMFYDLPDVGSYSLAGLTVSISVSNGMLSVTKLKATVSHGISTGSVLAEMDDLQVASVLDLIYGKNDGLDNDLVKSNVTRIYGDNRFETAFKVADELKTVLGVEKFDSIIIASGTNFADALSGSYLATVKNAPILLSYDDTYDQLVRDYIAKNLAKNGTVYILGGEAAVAASMDEALAASGVTVKRLAGANRFETNLAILSEAGVKNEEILVCTDTNFADSLSASAAGKPILLVHNESGKLTEEQAKYLAQLDGCTFTVIGGEAAVSADLENAVAAYGTTKRIAGENRFQTSVAIAETYMSNPENVVLAYAGNYPDGLCGGVLAHAMQAPLVLTMTGYESDACAYVNAVKAKTGVILGGSGLISDNSIVNIFNLTDALEIIVK